MENTISYGALERALGATFRLSPEATAGMLRGRIVHLRRAGFGPRGRGYGSRISYDRELATQWLLALLFEDAGLSPLNIKGLIEEIWETEIRPKVARARRSRTDIYLAVSFSELRDATGVPTIPNVMDVTVREAAELLRWITEERHVTIFNLSDALRVFDREIAAAQAP